MAELTYGEKAVGLEFNHAEGEAHTLVHELKVLAAKQIDILDAERKKVTNPSEKGAVLTHAIRQIQSSQMWAVKAVTLPEENLEEEK